MPAPPQVDRQFFESCDAFGQDRSIELSAHLSHAPTSAANLGRSMLPPETTATVGPLPALPESAAAIAQPAAPSPMTCTRSATSFMPRATSSSVTTIDPCSWLRSGHIVLITDLPPAPSTNEAVQLSK